MAAKSLASQTPGALSELKLPAVFQAPSEPVKARFIAPYITFAHPKRADEWKRLPAETQEGDMFLMEQDRATKLSPMKVSLLCCKQYWAEANAAGEILRVSWKEAPRPFKEHIEAVLLVYLEDRIVPANIQFRSTKCPAGKALSDALAEASTPAWSDKSPSHKETLVCTQPFMRFYGSIVLGPTRTSRTTGLPYRTTQCQITPTSVSEWRLLKALQDDETTHKKLNDAAERFEYRLAELKAKP